MTRHQRKAINDAMTLRKQARNPLATDFDLDIARGKQFWLGPIQASHTLGRYQLIEYREKPCLNSPPDFVSRTMFTGYINGKGTRHSCSSIEAAIANCITVAFNGYNDQAGEMFMRMLRRPEQP